MIPPISGVRKASFGCRSLCFQGHLYSTTLFGQPSEHWHCWILSRLAPRKGFDFEIRKRFETGSSLWWVWLATRCEHSLHGIAPTPWHFVVLFPVAGNACAVSWPMQYLLPILVTFSSLFLSSVAYLVKTLLYFEAVMKPALCKYQSSHCHCFEVVLSTCSLSASLKDNKLTTSSVEMLEWFLMTYVNLDFIIPVSALLSVDSAGSSSRPVSAFGLQ